MSMGATGTPLEVLILSMEWTPKVSGGVGTHVFELGTGLARIGCRVTVLAYTPGERQHIERGNLSVHMFPPSRQSFSSAAQVSLVEGILAFNRDLLTQAEPIIARRRPAIIHFHQWHTQHAARELGARFDIPIVGSSHHLSDPTERWWGQNPDPEILAQERLLYDGTIDIITVSDSMRQLICATYGMAPARVHRVHCALDLELFSGRSLDAANLARVRRSVASPEDKIVLYVGRIHPQKGIPAIYAAADRVVATVPRVRYLLAGGTDSRESTAMLHRLQSDYPHLKPHIKLLGKLPREQLSMLHRIADVVLVPSVYEPFGYTAIEAMASGMTVIVSDVGGLAEIVEHERSGLRVPVVPGAGPGETREVDVEALAAAQLRLLSDPALAQRLGRAGQQRVAETFSIERMIEGNMAVYRSAIARHRSGDVRPRVSSAGSAWVSCLRPRPQARVRLFCFPHAGGGAALFHAWHAMAPEHIEVCAIKLPGREERFRDAPYSTLAPLISVLRDNLHPFLEDRPFAFFGHSMGALVGFELARALRRHGAPLPLHLFVASYVAPHLQSRDVDWPKVEDLLSVDALREKLNLPEDMAGELLALVQLATKADVALCNDYRYAHEEPLDCPITAFRGTQDFVGHDDLLGWRAQTTRAFRASTLDGDHFFPAHRQAELIQAIAEDLGRSPP
jgi:starch synthase